MPAELFTEAHFQDQVLRSDIPVVVDVFTPRCPPCQILLPTLEKLAEEFAGKVKVVKVDASKDSTLEVLRGIFSVPVLIAYRDGVEVGRRIGLQNEKQLRAWMGSIQKT